MKAHVNVPQKSVDGMHWCLYIMMLYIEHASNKLQSATVYIYYSIRLPLLALFFSFCQLSCEQENKEKNPCEKKSEGKNHEWKQQ